MNKVSEKAREIIALLLLGVALFSILSTLSYFPGISPETGRSSNLCGQTGHYLAKYLLESFGYASYALFFCIALWGIILFIRKNIQSVLAKAFGLLAFTFFSAALLSHFLEGYPKALPDHGGLVGFYLNRFFTETLGLGAGGAKITLVLLAMITFLLATDWLYYSSLVAFAKWISKKRAAWRERNGTAEQAKKAVLLRKRHAALQVPLPDDLQHPVPEESSSDGKESPEEKKPGAIKSLFSRKKDREGKEKEEEPAAAEESGGSEAGKKKKEASKEGSATEVKDGDPIQYSPPPVERQKDYKPPAMNLLDPAETIGKADLKKFITETTAQLEGTLKSFKIDAEVVEIQRGPVITMFEMELAPGIKVERIRALEDDIAMAVKAQRVRIVAPIPGKSTFGIEVPNAVRELVRIRQLLSSPEFDDKHYALPICLGQDAAGRNLIDDLAKMPHLLVAGATGSGKSVCLNSIIMSILYTRTPEQTKLILVDPKMVELSVFKKIPHLMCPVVTDMKRASAILEWAVRLMDARYQFLLDAGVRNIYGYNKLGEKELRKRLDGLIDEDKFSAIMPFIVIIVDELADLMMIGVKEIESYITRLAQKSRAVGIHLILATQRPSTNVITGLIKANMPTRIAFMVASKIDSRVILDVNGAEKLLGQGDMLYIPPRSSILTRAQGAFVSDEEIRRVVDNLRESGDPAYEEELVGKRKDDAWDPFSIDELYEEAAGFIIETQRGSASLLQRRFSIGYTRASRLIDIMAQDGILGEYKGSQAREVITTAEEWEQRLNKLKRNHVSRTEGDTVTKVNNNM